MPGTINFVLIYFRIFIEVTVKGSKYFSNVNRSNIFQVTEDFRRVESKSQGRRAAPGSPRIHSNCLKVRKRVDKELLNMLVPGLSELCCVSVGHYRHYFITSSSHTPSRRSIPSVCIFLRASRGPRSSEFLGRSRFSDFLRFTVNRFSFASLLSFAAWIDWFLLARMCGSVDGAVVFVL